MKPWLFPCILAIASLVLLLGGLSVRSLWGPEGRWAAIVKEMISSGNWFVPTINGQLYFDKPLLSYWAMLPFALIGGLNEAMLRVPGVIAGMATVFVAFLVGRRFFGSFSAFLSGALLLLSPMFLFWSRTISAEMMNTLAVWIMIWAFFAARDTRKGSYVFLIYIVAAVASFLKGPVAAAVGFFVMVVTGLIETILNVRAKGPEKTALRSIFLREFFWIFSKPGFFGIAAGLVVFAILLFLPVIVTGSWVSVQLMWRENVTRFFLPFDHEDPAYAYTWAILLFCAPWTFAMLGALWQWRLKWSEPGARRVIEAAFAILLFYVLSGSRRGYYILPLIPALAIMTGEALKAWLESAKERFNAVGLSVAATIGLLALAGAAICYVYFGYDAYRHISEVPLALMVIAAAAIAFYFLAKKRRIAALWTILAIMFAVNLWGVTIASVIGERGRTLKEFALRASKEVDSVGPENLVLFRTGTAEFLFYLNKPVNIKNVIFLNEVKAFEKTHPKALLVLNMKDATPDLIEYIGKRTPLVQQVNPGDDGDYFVLLQLGKYTK